MRLVYLGLICSSYFSWQSLQVLLFNKFHFSLGRFEFLRRGVNLLNISTSLSIYRGMRESLSCQAHETFLLMWAILAIIRWCIKWFWYFRQIRLLTLLPWRWSIFEQLCLWSVEEWIRARVTGEQFVTSLIRKLLVCYQSDSWLFYITLYHFIRVMVGMLVVEAVCSACRDLDYFVLEFFRFGGLFGFYCVLCCHCSCVTSGFGIFSC